MSSEQSERIRAALLRSKAARQHSPSSTLEAFEESEHAQPLVASHPENETAPPEPKVVASEPSVSEPEEDAVDTLLDTAEDVEATLPWIAAREEKRAALFPDAPVSAESSKLAPAEQTLPFWPLIAAGAERKRAPISRVALAVGGIAAVAGLFAFLLLRDHGRTESKLSRSGAVAGFPLQMQVESQGNGIANIRWNPQSAAVAQAREGRLVISERDQQPRIIALTSEQLKIGHLFYQFAADRVEFRLEVVDRSGAVAKESVLALSSGIAPSPLKTETPAATGKEQSKIRQDAVATPGAPAVEAKAEGPKAARTQENQPASRPVIRSFTPPPTKPKTEEARAVLLDPPMAVAGGSVVTPAANLPEAVRRIAAPQVKQPPAPQRIRIGGNLQAANLIRKVAPDYPPLAKSAGIQGAVRFTATIGKDGKIQNLQLVSGPPLLVSAATAAVQKWVYKPMMLNGEPAEVITQIDVNFSLHQ